jgi:protein-disulfide isomerase
VARRKSQKRSGKEAAAANPLRPFYLILGAVAVVGLGVLVYQYFGSQRQMAVAPVPVVMDPQQIAQARGVAMGDEDAPVVIFEFADFQCPACAMFATFVAPLVKERLVEQGLVRYVYYDFPLAQHQHAFLASRAARCADDQGRFWEYHDVLYGRQNRWSRARDASSEFTGYAAEVGIDRGAFDACLRSDRHAEEVTRNQRLGVQLGVEGTPTIFVNGRRLPAPPDYRQLEALVMQEVEGTAGEPADRTGDEAPGG